MGNEKEKQKIEHAHAPSQRHPLRPEADLVAPAVLDGRHPSRPRMPEVKVFVAR